MSKRTEEQILAQDPIEVILGGKKYQIAPLVIKDSRPWRKKAASFQALLARYASVNSDNPKEFEKTLTELFGSRIDKTVDLFFAYAKDLNRKNIEKVATDKEIVAAFREVIKVAFPFGG